jgi:PelA/Pel-15E family pectate lyase
VEAAEISSASVLGGEDHWNPLTVPSAAREGLSPSPTRTEDRIHALPDTEREPWLAYFQHSSERLAKDKAALMAELQAAGLSEPLPPPTSEDFKLSVRGAEWFASEEAQQLARVALLFQTPSGGWSKSVAYDKGQRQPGMHWSSQASRAQWHYVGTFDNRSTTEQMRLLAGVYQATGGSEFRDGFLKALDYLLAAQFPNGGWPQGYPLEDGYHDAITFNDETMIRILELLQAIATGQPEFTFVESRERVAAALAAGIGCLLKTQLVQDGQRTAWCAQHDPLTLAPVPARLKEPASLSGSESVGIVRFLMRLPEPSKEVVRAVEDALVWFGKSKLSGLRPIKCDGRSFWEQNPAATEPIWARFYDLATNQPIFAGSQDGIIYDSFETMWRNNRFGYDFYTDRPDSLRTREEPKWRKMLTSQRPRNE